MYGCVLRMEKELNWLKDQAQINQKLLRKEFMGKEQQSQLISLRVMIKFELEAKLGEKKFKQQLDEGYFEEDARITDMVD